MRPSLTPPLALSAAAGERFSSPSRLCPATPLPLTSTHPPRAYLILQSMVASRGEGSQEAAAPPEGKRQAPVRPGRERRTRGEKGSAGSCLACSSSPRASQREQVGVACGFPGVFAEGGPSSRSFASPARRDGGRKSSTSLPASLLPLSVPAAEKRLLRHLVESRKLYGGWRNLFPGPWPGLLRRTDA